MRTHIVLLGLMLGIVDYITLVFVPHLRTDWTLSSSTFSCTGYNQHPIMPFEHYLMDILLFDST